MTIEDAIKHEEEMEKEQEELYRLCPASESGIFRCDGTKDCVVLKNGKNKGCQKCAEEHRQLEEWLKDYKRLKEQQSCGDAISRQAVLEKAINVPIAKIVTDDKVICRKVIFVDDVEQLPSVTPQPKMGRWIDEKDGYGTRCSECGKWYSHSILTKQEVLYCSSCGAKMQEVEK